MGFSEEFASERERVIRAAQEVVKVAAIEMVNAAITISPVGNAELWLYKHPTRGYIDYLGYFGSAPDGYVGGRFRSNWFLTQTVPSAKSTTEIKDESSMIGAYTQQILGKYSDSWVLTNNLPYAQRIDDGWSSQSPTGITDPVALHVNARIPEIQRTADKKYGVS